MFSTSELKKAFSNILIQTQANDGNDSNNDLVIIGMSLGNTEEEIKEQFPSLCNDEKDEDEIEEEEDEDEEDKEEEINPEDLK